jgi:hypothetical protein
MDAGRVAVQAQGEAKGAKSKWPDCSSCVDGLEGSGRGGGRHESGDRRGKGKRKDSREGTQSWS